MKMYSLDNITKGELNMNYGKKIGMEPDRNNVEFMHKEYLAGDYIAYARRKNEPNSNWYRMFSLKFDSISMDYRILTPSMHDIVLDFKESPYKDIVSGEELEIDRTIMKKKYYKSFNPENGNEIVKVAFELFNMVNDFINQLDLNDKTSEYSYSKISRDLIVQSTISVSANTSMSKDMYIRNINWDARYKGEDNIFSTTSEDRDNMELEDTIARIPSLRIGK